jgi:hypothetical protein
MMFRDATGHAFVVSFGSNKFGQLGQGQTCKKNWQPTKINFGDNWAPE